MLRKPLTPKALTPPPARGYPAPMPGRGESRSLKLARLASLLALVLLLAPPPALAQAVPPDRIDQEALEIAKQLQCPVCQGTAVAYSTSGLAEQMRGVIRQKLEAGESREQIMQYFVDRYGENILIEPPKSGFTLSVWLLPMAGLLVGLVIVVFVVRASRRRASSGPPPPAAPGLDAIKVSEADRKRYLKRLEADLVDMDGRPLA